MTTLEYLDHNVFMALHLAERPGLREQIDARKTAGIRFPYSPAHIEEVAILARDNLKSWKANSSVVENLQVIEEISDGWELLPNLSGPTRLVQEPPADCMQRVIDEYSKTLAAEESERFQRSFKSPKAFDQVQKEFGTPLRAELGVTLHSDRRDQNQIDVKVINNLSESQLFANANVLEGLEHKLWHSRLTVDTLPKGDELMRSHNLRQTVVNLVLAYIDEIGFRADAFNNFRSHMHDVSHAIYAAATNVLITNDERFRRRVVAAYHFLEMRTRVIGLDEFVASETSTPSRGNAV